MSIDNFTGKAQAYAIGRPSYPKTAINAILKYASDDTVFADVGAGTGKLTEQLLESNCSIYAIEPNDDMLLQLKKQLDRKNQVTILKGTSEATQLPDQSVDIVTVAHALHWFDLEAFKKECQRILRPNGYVIAI